MRVWKKLLSVGVFVAMATLLTVPAAAQEEEAAESERQRALEQAGMSMREAEQQLEEAARRIAELSSEQLALVGEYEQRMVIESGRPVLGITIASQSMGPEGSGGPVEGVAVIGISPGGAADDAGIRTGDIITAINGESFSSANDEGANKKLTDFMRGVEEGDVLEVDYLRNGKMQNVELSPKERSARVFGFRFDGRGPNAPPRPVAPHVSSYAWIERFGGYGFGEMEMIELNKSLGRYFGTDSGLLIVRAPQDNSYQLQDGDVLKSIDGRSPENLRHAIRILSSYESGEKVNLKILRDKREKTITIEIPDNRRSQRRAAPNPRPAVAVAPALAPSPDIVVAPNVRVVRKVEEST